MTSRSFITTVCLSFSPESKASVSLFASLSIITLTIALFTDSVSGGVVEFAPSVVLSSAFSSPTKVSFLLACLASSSF